MKKIIFVLTLLISSSGIAQIDQSDHSNPDKKIGREAHNIGRESPKAGNRSIGRGFSSGSDNKRLLGAPDKVDIDLDDNDDEVDINKKSEFISPEMQFNPAYAKKPDREGKVKKEFSEPQDLGKFSTSGDFVKVSWRDAQVVDGDRVDIIVNGEVEAHNVTLLSEYHSMYVDLDEGFTKIEFQALNQGESGPNTADFKVEADDGSILTQNQWNLTTGTKAHLVVVKR